MGHCSQTFESFGNGLLELHVGSNLAFCGVADRLGIGSGREDTVSSQGAVLQVDMQSSRRRMALRAKDTGRFSSHFGLGEIQHDHAAVDELGPGTMAGIGQGDRVVGMDQRAIFKNDVRMFGHRLLPSAHAGPPPYRPPSRVPGNSNAEIRSARPAHGGIGHAAAKCSARSYAVLDHHGETFAALIGQIEEEASVATGHVQIAERPTIPDDAGKRLLVVAVRPMLVRRTDWAPPVPALEPLLRVSAVNHDPACCARAQAAVEIANQHVVTPRRARRGPAQDWLPCSDRAAR